MLRIFTTILLVAHASGCFADSRLEQLLRGTDLTPALSGLQVSLLHQDGDSESFALGFAQLPSEGREALRSDHKIRVASISKLFVAVGVMRLFDAGKLDLDTDVSQYLGWQLRNPAFPRTSISTRQLLAHTSSVRDGSAYFIPAGAGELQDFFRPDSDYWEEGIHYAQQEGRGPGSYFSYANLNFGLIGEVIERLSGQRFDQYMAAEVLEPLGLSARFDPCAVAREQRAAAFRKRDTNEQWDPAGPWYPQVDAGPPTCFYGMQALPAPEEFLATYGLGSNASLYSPQGGLRASAEDLLIALKLLADAGEVNGQRILSSHAVATMLAPEWTLNAAGTNGLSAGEAAEGGPTDGLMTSYGLSVHRIDLRAWGFKEGPTLLLGHLGEAYGVLSHALFDPKSGEGIATIVTGTADDPAASPGSSPLYRVEEEILRWWLERIETD